MAGKNGGDLMCVEKLQELGSPLARHCKILVVFVNALEAHGVMHEDYPVIERLRIGLAQCSSQPCHLFLGGLR